METFFDDTTKEIEASTPPPPPANTSLSRSTGWRRSAEISNLYLVTSSQDSTSDARFTPTDARPRWPCRYATHPLAPRYPLLAASGVPEAGSQHAETGNRLLSNLSLALVSSPHLRPVTLRGFDLPGRGWARISKGAEQPGEDARWSVATLRGVMLTLIVVLWR